MTIKYMDLTEFRYLGYLQELNRRFLHPLGLALEVNVLMEADGSSTVTQFGGIWDYRDDPEGISYADDAVDAQARFRAQYVRGQLLERSSERFARLGYVIQPVGDTR